MFLVEGEYWPIYIIIYILDPNGITYYHFCIVKFTTSPIPTPLSARLIGIGFVLSSVAWRWRRCKVVRRLSFYEVVYVQQ